MNLRDVLEWPPTSCAGTYSGLDQLLPDPAQATIRKAKSEGNLILLDVAEGYRSWSCTVHVPQAYSVSLVLAALQRAAGKTLDAAGEEPVLES